MTLSSVLLPQPDGPRIAAKCFFGKRAETSGEQQLVIGRVAELEGDILEFEHGAASVVD